MSITCLKNICQEVFDKVLSLHRLRSIDFISLNIIICLMHHNREAINLQPKIKKNA